MEKLYLTLTAYCEAENYNTIFTAPILISLYKVFCIMYYSYFAAAKN